MKIIDIGGREKYDDRYRKALEGVSEELGQIEEHLMGAAIYLATSGKWREWSDGVKVGESVHFTHEMLKDTGDPNVDLLMGLLDQVRAGRKKIDGLMDTP